MRRYFFHLHDHEDRLVDPLGQIFDNEEGAAKAALHEARAILSHEVIAGTLNLDQRIEIEDEDGKIVHTLQFRDAVTIKA